MIDVVAISDTMVKITVHGRNFDADLDRIRNDIPREFRSYDPMRKVWMVRDANKLEVDYIKRALSEFKEQLKLF